MQSFIQYRSFRARAQEQLDRDRAKAQGARPDGESSSTPSPESDESKVDLEKGAGAGAGANGAAHVPGSAEPGLSTAETARGEEEEAMHQNQPREAHAWDDREAAEEAEEKPEASSEDDGGDEDDDYELAAMNSRTLTKTASQQTQGTALGNVLTGIEVRRRSTKEGGDGNVFIVGYEGPDDPNNPHNWSLTRRIFCTSLIAMIGCVVGFASAIDSTAVSKAAKDFNVSEVTESLATGLFLVGFGVGGLFAGPISETVGRNPVYIATLTLFMIFEMAAALSPNIAAQLVFRFIAGFFGSTPLTCAGGSISDLWDPMERVFAFPIFANAAFTGPLLGPVLGGFIVESNVSWRWVDWTTLIFAGLVTILVALFQPETYPPVLLKWKAAHLRELTGDERYCAAIEIRQESLWHRLRRALYRPFLLTFREPIIIIVALYLTVIYIILFGFLDGYDYIFKETYGISEGLTGLCFVGIIVGLFGASALVPIIYKWAKRDLAKIQEAGGDRLPPEFRLWFSMLGGSFAIPVSLFWMGWTARADISIWSPLAASVLFGYGILCVFITSYQYIIDSYEIYAASALASITLIRYVASGAITIIGIPFYENEGVAYTLTIFACFAALMAPFPYIFFKYGPAIRKKSKYAVDK